MSDPRERAEAEAEAIEWIILLQEDPNDAALGRRFEAWRRTPDNERAWQEAQAAYRGIGRTLPAYPERWQKAVASPRPHPHIRRRAPLFVAAAMCAAAALVVAYCGADHTGTGTAELRQLSLADGSRIELGPHTAIAFEISPHARTARLLRGEAWFDIHHDAARPFAVMAGSARTVDVGTSFGVELTRGATTVAVRTGAVDVSTTDGAAAPSQHLRAGNLERIGVDGRVSLATLPSALVGAWRERRLVVQDRPLGDVVDSMRGWYRGLVLIAPGVDTHRRVTGVYDMRDPVAALAALMEACRGHVRRVTPWITVLADG